MRRSGWRWPGWQCVPRVSEGGVPTMPPFLTCLFCPSKNGRVKNNWFFETEIDFLSGWATWRVGVREPKRHLWWAADSGYSQAVCRFNDDVCWTFGFPRGCPPINSILCSLLLFSTAFFWDSFLRQPCAYCCFFWVKTLEFFTVICCALTVLALRSATFASLWHSVRILYALFFPFVRFGVVGLFGRVLFVTGCFKGFSCPPVVFVGRGFLVGVESKILE